MSRRRGPTVTRRQIDSARLEFERQAQARKAAGMDERSDSADANTISVVVAENVTREMLMAIPTNWARGLVFVLRANGTLELMDVETREHQNVKGIMESDFANYAIQHAPLYTAFPENYDEFDHENHRPYATLKWSRPNNTREPVLVGEVEIHHRSVNELIQVAREYLQDHRVQLVFGCKIFESRDSALEVSEVEKAALAVVFERVPGPVELNQDQEYPIRIVHEVSFGNVPLWPTVLTNLGAVPSLTDAIVPRAVTIPRSQNEDLVIQRDATAASFANLQRQELLLDLENGLPPITFRLHEYFRHGVEGWTDDNP